jgi:hypothetical protein
MSGHVTFQTVELKRGKHTDPRQGACVMELVSMLAGEQFTDRPATACPVIAGFLRAYNDRCTREQRQELYELAALVVGTCADDDTERARLRLIVDTAAGMRRFARPPRRLPKEPTGRAAEQLTTRAAVRLTRCHAAGHAATLALVQELVAMAPDVEPSRPASSQPDRPHETTTLT